MAQSTKVKCVCVCVCRYYGCIAIDGVQRKHTDRVTWVVLFTHSGPIPLGPMAGLIFALMLIYNGVLGAIVYKASRFPQGMNLQSLYASPPRDTG